MAGKLQGIYPEALLKQLAAGKVLPVYYFTGDDAYEKQQVRAQLLARLKPDESCVHKLTGPEVRSGDVAALAESLSLFGGSRLIWIDDAHRILASEKKPLAEYVNAPNPSTCLVFSSDDWKTDAGEPLMAGAQVLGGLVHFRGPTGARLADWVTRSAVSRGFKLEPGAVDRLIEEAGEDRTILDQELARLALYKRGSVGGGRGSEIPTASEADVLACLGYTEGREIRDLEKALSAAMAARTLEARREAVQLVDKLIEEGEEPVKLSNYAGYAVQHLMAAKRLMAAGLPAGGIKMKVGAWGNDEVAFHAQKIPQARLLRALRSCCETELRLKSGAPSPELEVRELVLKLTA